MTDRRFQSVDLSTNPEPLPGDFGADLSRLDRELGAALSRVEAPAGLAGRVFSMSAGFLTAPAALPLTVSPQIVVRQRRTMWARFAVAASLATLFVLAGRVVIENGATIAPLDEQGETIVQASLEQPLPHAVEMLLLDRTPNRMSEEIAYLFDPDPRESSEMSLFVQTREVTLDDVSVELAMLDADLRM
jgi:hypothetical protein